MKRLLANTIMVVGGITASSQLLALGLGELTLKSSLNQPLKAEIELLDIKGLTSWDIKPSLASAADFERAGVEREYFLTRIAFKVEDNRVVLTSREPVNEPFLNFLVELNWPSGRVLREYTVLLDPPVFEETSFQPLVNAPVQQGYRPEMGETQLGQQAKPVAVNRWDALPETAGTYKVQQDDTLWEIALKTRPDRSISAQQMMLAIQQENPNAFISGNINRLKTHQVLNIPDAERVRAISMNEAVAEVARQNRELTGAAQLDATGRGAAPAGNRPQKDGGEVRLLANKSDASDTANSSGEVAQGEGDGRQQAMENDLAIALENVDKSRRENEELRKRLEALEEQINTMQRLVSLKDDQLASLQAGKALSPAAEETTDFNFTADDTTEQAPAATETEVVDVAESTAEEDSAAARRARIAAMLAAEQEQQRPEPSLVDKALENPIYPAAGLGLLALLGLLLAKLFKRRKSEEPSESEHAFADMPEADLDNVSLDEFDFDEDVTVDAPGKDVADEAPVAAFDNSAQTNDPIGESDIYIAYGKFEQAESRLKLAISKEPQRTDLRLKLLEVYVEMDDAKAYAQQEGELNALGDAQADKEAASMRQRLMSPMAPIAAAAASSAADMDLSEDFDDAMDFDAALDLSDEPVGETVTALSDADDLPTLDMEAELDVDFGQSQDIPVVADSAGDNNDLEFDLSDFDVTPQAETTAVAAETSDDNSLDFDLDALADSSADEAPAAADLSIDMDDELLAFDSVTDEKSVVEEDVPALSLDDDLSLDFDQVETEATPSYNPQNDLDTLLADGQTEGELPDLSFELDDTGFSEADTDDLKALESEMDAALSVSSVSAPSEELSFDEPSLAADEPMLSLDNELDAFDDTELTVDLSAPAKPLVDADAAGEIDLDQLAMVDDEFDFLAGTDECATKLDLARAYIDMEDAEGARELLQEVVQEGTDQQKTEARELMNNLA